MQDEVSKQQQLIKCLSASEIVFQETAGGLLAACVGGTMLLAAPGKLFSRCKIHKLRTKFSASSRSSSAATFLGDFYHLCCSFQLQVRKELFFSRFARLRGSTIVILVAKTSRQQKTYVPRTRRDGEKKSRHHDESTRSSCVAMAAAKLFPTQS